jgi:type VI protein secretion system component VasF
MPDVESERPWFLNRSQRRWWKRTTVWIMILAFLVVAAVLFGLLSAYLERDSDDDSDDSSNRGNPCPQACGRARP